MIAEKIAHYEWMLDTLELSDSHRYWIIKQHQLLTEGK